MDIKDALYNDRISQNEFDFLTNDLDVFLQNLLKKNNLQKYQDAFLFDVFQASLFFPIAYKDKPAHTVLYDWLLRNRISEKRERIEEVQSQIQELEQWDLYRMPNDYVYRYGEGSKEEKIQERKNDIQELETEIKNEQKIWDVLGTNKDIMRAYFEHHNLEVPKEYQTNNKPENAKKNTEISPKLYQARKKAAELGLKREPDNKLYKARLKAAELALKRLNA